MKADVIKTRRTLLFQDEIGELDVDVNARPEVNHPRALAGSRVVVGVIR